MAKKKATKEDIIQDAAYEFTRALLENTNDAYEYIAELGKTTSSALSYLVQFVDKQRYTELIYNFTLVLTHACINSFDEVKEASNKVEKEKPKK